MQSASIRCATAVQVLARAARAQGLVVPGFRSPSRLGGVHRPIKRWDGGATIALEVTDRPWAAVQADLVEGDIAGNRMHGEAADAARGGLGIASQAPPQGRGQARDGGGGRMAG